MSLTAQEFTRIANHLQGELDSLDVLNKVSFAQYKEVYDTLIALRQAQALQEIADYMHNFHMNGFPVTQL